MLLGCCVITMRWEFLYFRGGKYTEEDAKAILVQILSVVSFCHVQGVVHRDLKPEVFTFEFHSNALRNWKVYCSRNYHISDALLLLLDQQNFLFTSGGEDADMKLIDFGLSDFIRPGKNWLSPINFTWVHDEHTSLHIFCKAINKWLQSVMIICHIFLFGSFVDLKG